MRKKCSSCGFEFDENVNACPKCGGKVEVISEEKVSNEVNAKKFCLYCGKQVDASAKICPECGANFETGASGKSSNYNTNNNMN